jgi:hypothetical protein
VLRDGVDTDEDVEIGMDEEYISGVVLPVLAGSGSLLDGVRGGTFSSREVLRVCEGAAGVAGVSPKLARLAIMSPLGIVASLFVGRGMSDLLAERSTERLVLR